MQQIAPHLSGSMSAILKAQNIYLSQGPGK